MSSAVAGSYSQPSRHPPPLRLDRPCRRCSHLAAAPASLPILLPSPVSRQFVTFGDSITQRGFSPGWTGTLADTYQRRADIINRGYSGYNTRWALHLLPHIFPLPPTNAAAAAAAPPPPRLVTVWFGANDAALPDRAS